MTLLKEVERIQKEETPKQPVRTKPIYILFCLPGKEFSGKFLQCWTKLLIYCLKNNISCEILQMFSSNVHHTRECFLSYTVMSKTERIKAFGGKDYDYVMWIDSDQVFGPEHLERLLKRMDDPNVHIVGGAIKVNTGPEFAFGFYDKHLMNQCELKRWTTDIMQGRQALIEVDYMGLAFTLVRKGVFESLKFPWFTAMPWNVVEGGEDLLGDMGEDLSFCWRLQNKGYKLYIDPTVRIGHEKLINLI